MEQFTKLARWFMVAILVLLVLGGGAVYWATRPLEPMPEALTALQSDDTMLVDTSQWIVFRPRAAMPTTGFIFYPGALVDPRAYAPMARAIAAQGYLVVVVPMPFNLALLATSRAHQVQVFFPQMQTWAIGGHSLGGVAASMFVKSNPDPIKGLVLWASYPADTDSLAQSGVAVVSISATNDKLATPDKINASRPLLPSNTRYVVIDGGNHGQFGWYGKQSGDGDATISREAQQSQIVQATVDLLKTLR